MQEVWIRTDEAEDVASSIRHASRSRTFVGDDDQAWKWVALALHSALQGACVCHLVGTAQPLGIVTKANAAEWCDYFERSRNNQTISPPRTHLMTLPDLLKSIRKPHSAGDRRNNEGISLTDSEFNWLKRFHDDLRNQFIHFGPMGWSIEVSGIPELGRLIARLITDIETVGWAFRSKDIGWRNSLRRNLSKLKDAPQLSA